MFLTKNEQKTMCNNIDEIKKKCYIKLSQSTSLITYNEKRG